MHRLYKKIAMLIANINLVTVVTIQKTIQRQKFSQLGGSGFPSGQTVPNSVINVQGHETSDKEEALNTRRSHFSNLSSP